MASPERQIENLIYMYAERLDAGNLTGVAELLKDAEVSGESGQILPQGKHDLSEFYRSILLLDDEGKPNTHHVTTNVIVKVSECGENANARSYFTVLQATDKLPLQAIITGRYEDKFSCIDGTWQFTHRRMCKGLIGNLEHHLNWPS